MANVVYFLCALTSIGCALLLFRGYRETRTRLLMWSALCFLGMAFNNVLFFVDMVVLPEVNMWGPLLRSLVGATSGGLLLYGFIMELS